MIQNPIDMSQHIHTLFRIFWIKFANREIRKPPTEQSDIPNAMWYSWGSVLFQCAASFQLFMSIWIFLLFHTFLCWLLVLLLCVPFEDETNRFFFLVSESRAFKMEKNEHFPLALLIISRPFYCIRNTTIFVIRIVICLCIFWLM